MNFLIAANFVRNMPWSHGWWAVVVARGLAARGHTVRAVVDGTECPAAFGAVPLTVARPDRIHLGAHPSRFVKLARELAARDPGTVTISFSPMAPGDLWIAQEPTPLEVVRSLVGNLKPVSLALELVHHPWLAFEAAAAWRARGTKLRFGPSPDNTSPAILPMVSPLTPHAIARGRATGALIRQTLGVPTDKPLMVVSLIDAARRDLSRRLAAWGERPMIALSSRPHSVATLAAQAGLTGVLPMTPTRSVEVVLAASDVAVALPPSRSHATSGRWICDAIAMGVPVLADVDAPGSGLVERTGCGEVVRSEKDWPAALERAADPACRDRWRRAASVAAPTVAFDRVLERLEHLAREVVSRRDAATV